MAKVPNGVETRNIAENFNRLSNGYTNVTDRQTDGLGLTYSERELFTFANNAKLCNMWPLIS